MLCCNNAKAAARVALRTRLPLARVLLDATTSAGRGLERGLVLARFSAGLGGGNLGDLVGLVLARCSAVLGGGELGGLGSRRWIAGGDRDRCLLQLLRLLRDL